ncbi:MAG: InlB B-repeat-containing protein, partial [Spirochaetales bacterium]|nr:InlB B-repeat-containing protein [Spirochaetales bacterium]
MTKNIKLMITFAIIMLIACVLSGCNNSEITSSVEAESIITEQVTETAPRATVSLSAEMITSRSAVPEVTPESIDKFILYINDSQIGIDPNNACIIGLWTSYESMRDTTMDVETGTWTFTLSAISKKITYIASKTVNLVAGSNSLHFELAESMRELDRGYGDLSVELRYDPDEEIGLITCGLYNTQEQVILGSGNTLLAQQAGGRVTYTQTKVPSGDYFVIFNIYADTEKKLLRSSFREYACIFSGKTSESICEIPSLAKVYTISYNLGKNGKWVSGYTPNTKFTRLGADIELPPEDKVTRDGFEFDGWY